MVDLPIYDVQAKCKKCGVGPRHNVSYVCSSDIIFRLLGRNDINEIMLRECVMCGYRWTELPLNLE